MRQFTFFFHIDSSKPSVYFTHTANFSSTPFSPVQLSSASGYLIGQHMSKVLSLVFGPPHPLKEKMLFKWTYARKKTQASLKEANYPRMYRLRKNLLLLTQVGVGQIEACWYIFLQAADPSPSSSVVVFPNWTLSLSILTIALHIKIQIC